MKNKNLSTISKIHRITQTKKQDHQVLLKTNYLVFMLFLFVLTTNIHYYIIILFRFFQSFPWHLNQRFVTR